MNIRYTPWFEVVFQHNHYTSGKCDDFDISLSASTATLVKNNLVLFRPLATEADFFYSGPLNNNGTTQAPLVLTGTNDLCLSFELRLNDLNFANFTDLGTEQGAGLFYFNNLGSAAGTELSQKGFVSAADWLPTKPLRFSCTLPSQSSVKVSVTKAGNTLFTDTVDATVSNAYSIDLSVYGPGVYDLSINGDTQVFYALATTIAPPPFAVVEIYATGNVPQAKQIAENGQPSHKQFTLSFNTRSTVWNYYIIGDSIDLNNVTLEVQATSQPAFGEPQSVVLYTGEQAMCITSDAPIELLEKPAGKWTLQLSPKTNRDGLRAMEIPLPIASVKAIEPQTQANGQVQVMSNMYVYL